MASDDFVLDPNFIDDLAHSPEVLALCMEAAEGIADIARQTAPVDTGEYRNSIHVRAAQRAGRVAAEAVAEDPKAMIIEARTGNLARALRRHRG